MTLVLALLPLVAGDLPVHCLIGDFKGSWVLHLGKTVAPGDTGPGVPDFRDGGMGEDYCFSGHPNRNSHNVKLDIPTLFKAKNIPTDQMFVELTENVAVRQDNSEHMVASVGNFAPVEGMQASWTTTYDEGWELRVGPQFRFFALAKYECAPGSDSCGQDGQGEESDGTTTGYSSHCGKTLVGWYHTDEGKGCFYGEKVDDNQAAKVHSYVLLETAKSQGKLKMHTAYHHNDFNIMPSYVEILEHHKNGGSRDFQTTRRAGSMKRHRHGAVGQMRLRDQCHGDDIAMADNIKAFEAEHKNFDWRQEFGNKWNTPVMDQGGCGSCYAIAMTYVLQSRANIAMMRAMKEKAEASGVSFAEMEAPQPVSLSSHSTLACSYYNQGCDGGYPYLIAKHSVDFGIPSESCQPYGSVADGEVQECKSECFADESKVMYAENYNYVGGFYGVCGQYHMMKSLVENGPLVVAIEVPVPFNTASAGYVVGSSYLHQLRRSNEDTHRDDATDSEVHSPDEHKRRNPLGPVKMLEAKWNLKDGAECQTSEPLEAGPANLKKSLSPAVVSRGESRFALNSDELPATADPYGESITRLAEGLKVPESCISLEMADGTMNGWEYTNHAITLVGWGEQTQKNDEGEDETVKYWIIRNSWGDYYGDSGYAYVLRGQDYGGIESQAVDVSVDKSRGMMKAMLDRVDRADPESLLQTRAHQHQRKVEVDALGNVLPVSTW